MLMNVDKFYNANLAYILFVSRLTTLCNYHCPVRKIKIKYIYKTHTNYCITFGRNGAFCGLWRWKYDQQIINTQLGIFLFTTVGSKLTKDTNSKEENNSAFDYLDGRNKNSLFVIIHL